MLTGTVLGAGDIALKNIPALVDVSYRKGRKTTKIQSTLDTKKDKKRMQGRGI